MFRFYMRYVQRFALVIKLPHCCNRLSISHSFNLHRELMRASDDTLNIILMNAIFNLIWHPDIQETGLFRAPAIR